MAQESLIVGWTRWEPFSFLDEQQQLRGLDIDLVNAIFLRADYQTKFSEMPWARVLHELKFGTVQLAMSANITPERQQYARFSHSYREEETAIAIRRQDIARWRGITSLEQLINTPEFHIGLLKGFDYGDTFRQLIKRPDLQARFQTRLRLEQLLKMLQGGRIQGIVLDPYGLREWQGKDRLQDELHILLPIELTPVHLMLSKKSTTEAQLQRINQAIEQLRQSPEYLQILDRYQYRVRK